MTQRSHTGHTRNTSRVVFFSCSLLLDPHLLPFTECRFGCLARFSNLRDPPTDHWPMPSHWKFTSAVKLPFADLLTKITRPFVHGNTINLSLSVSCVDVLLLLPPFPLSPPLSLSLSLCLFLSLSLSLFLFLSFSLSLSPSHPLTLFFSLSLPLFISLSLSLYLCVLLFSYLVFFFSLSSLIVALVSQCRALVPPTSGVPSYQAVPPPSPSDWLLLMRLALPPKWVVERLVCEPAVRTLGRVPMTVPLCAVSFFLVLVPNNPVFPCSLSRSLVFLHLSPSHTPRLYPCFPLLSPFSPHSLPLLVPNLFPSFLPVSLHCLPILT